MLISLFKLKIEFSLSFEAFKSGFEDYVLYLYFIDNLKNNYF